VFQTKVVEKKKHILRSITFFFKSRRLWDMWKDIVERARTHMTIWGTRIACWIPKATNTHSKYIIVIAFPLQQWLTRTLLNEHCTYIAFLVLEFSWGALYSVVPRGTEGPLKNISVNTNPLALELDIYSLAHHLCKMWIFHEPRMGNIRKYTFCWGINEDGERKTEKIIKYICWLNV